MYNHTYTDNTYTRIHTYTIDGGIRSYGSEICMHACIRQYIMLVVMVV